MRDIPPLVGLSEVAIGLVRVESKEAKTQNVIKQKFRGNCFWVRRRLAEKRRQSGVASWLIEVVVVGGGKGQSIAMPSRRRRLRRLLVGFRPTQAARGSIETTTTGETYCISILSR